MNVACDHYETEVQKVTPAEFIASQLGMVHEVLTQYGPVNRFWCAACARGAQRARSAPCGAQRARECAARCACVRTHHLPGPPRRFDGTTGMPPGTKADDLWSRVYEEIRAVSPDTIISPYRGDVCAAIDTVYTNTGPPPNTTDTSACGKGAPGAPFFHPTEMHGITAQVRRSARGKGAEAAHPCHHRGNALRRRCRRGRWLRVPPRGSAL